MARLTWTAHLFDGFPVHTTRTAAGRPLQIDLGSNVVGVFDRFVDAEKENYPGEVSLHAYLSVLNLSSAAEAARTRPPDELCGSSCVGWNQLQAVRVFSLGDARHDPSRPMYVWAELNPGDRRAAVLRSYAAAVEMLKYYADGIFDPFVDPFGASAWEAYCKLKASSPAAKG